MTSWGPPSSLAERGGHLVINLMLFARVLRGIGLPIGPGRVIDAVRAVLAIDITRREDFYWALHAVFVNRGDQRDLFEQAFRLFFVEQLSQGSMLAAMAFGDVPGRENKPETSRRLRELLQRPSPRPPSTENESPPSIEVDVAMTYSDRELLQTKDFEEMSGEEIRYAKAMMARLRLPIADRSTRRFRPHARGARVDPRATLRASLRAGSSFIPLRWRAVRKRPPPLVLLCDISGSMDRYSRVLMHFMHAVTNDRDRVHVFLFGTRLSNVTRYLRRADIDEALAKVGATIEDWAGGTRIGACLAEFNRWWSRRVLGQGAVVLLITDGLDRDSGAGLEREMERLHKSCRRLIWLNPLLRFEGFEPRATGIKAMLPHVDDFRAVHNLESLEQLVQALR